ncbi:MAG: dihydroorotate dehydrogenase electron transfer subunit [Candidatus Syntrophosphaera sp.]
MPDYKTLPLQDFKKLGDKYIRFSVKDAGLSAKCEPGMFFEVKADVPYQADKLFKPLSIYGSRDGEISFLVKVIGAGTTALASLGKGSSIKLIGPLGNSFPRVKDSSVLLVSGGVGYPPMAWLKEVLETDNEVFLLHGGACLDDIFPCDEAYTIDGSKGRKGLVTDGVREIIASRAIDLVYGCGPVPMLRALSVVVENIPLHVSLEAYMACGIGVCHGCAVPVGDGYKMVCADGPVFNAADIRWGEM